MFGQLNHHTPKADETALGTSGVISRYHALLNTPFSHPLGQVGYIIGIEKAPRDKAGYRHDTDGRAFDPTRLSLPTRLPASGAQTDLDQQQAAFKRALDDPKVMLVSHILRYAHDADGQGIEPQLFHSAYSNTAFGPVPDAPLADAYEAGWAALDRMEAQLLSDIEQAKAEGHPFTHLVLLSMGWNNDQFEALERYNAILQHTRRAARDTGERFNPMVIGLTWPSVWGGTSVIDLANRALHLGSYPVKADDADEIGYGIANHLVNAMLPRLEAQTGLRSVLLGHSMGARIVTRAYYSAELLNGAVPRTGLGPIVIGLQAAFSANRFSEGYRLIVPVRWIASGEGGPYQEQSRPGGQMALTWSARDYANPLARLLSGAAHVGARPGAKIMHETHGAKVHAATWHAGGDLGGDCATAREAGKVLYIDASETVAAHGDIRTPETGRLVWSVIRGFSG